MMPFEGTVSSQPYCTMQILRIIQETYRKVLFDKNKKMMEKQKRQQQGHARPIRRR